MSSSMIVWDLLLITGCLWGALTITGLILFSAPGNTRLISTNYVTENASLSLSYQSDVIYMIYIYIYMYVYNSTRLWYVDNFLHPFKNKFIQLLKILFVVTHFHTCCCILYTRRTIVLCYMHALICSHIFFLSDTWDSKKTNSRPDALDY